MGQSWLADRVIKLGQKGAVTLSTTTLSIKGFHISLSMMTFSINIDRHYAK